MIYIIALDCALSTQLRAFSVKLLTVQIKGSNTQFSNSLYLPPGQKKSGVSGHINYRWRVDAKWATFEAQKKSKNATIGMIKILQK